jgi:hypothetical protein
MAQILPVRDNWESKRAEIEEKYSKLLKTPWKVEVNPLEIGAYGTGTKAETPGTVIYGSVAAILT